MYFRGQRKSASDVSLSECIETGRDGNALSLMDVICSEEDLFEQLSEKEIYGRLHAAVNTCLTPREQRIILLRYGPQAADTAGDRRAVRHQPQLRQPHRKTRPAEAGGRADKRNLKGTITNASMETFLYHHAPPLEGAQSLLPRRVVLARPDARPVQILPHRVLDRRKILSGHAQPELL